ncbi:nurim homolog [Agrilus planipennis]|uniref:Nuclear envelope membrane protein n=1 Tax=Agrilus planipennis TaxID=224129 RepID=A0A1W4XSG9_AGRPL|nr:nurim homolog [Agrilus planipennis]
MSALKVIQSVFYTGVALLSVFHTFYTVVDLMAFLSFPNYNLYLLRKEVNGISVTWNLIIDMCLLTAFIFQHSLMTLSSIKDFISKIKLSVLQRSIYVISSSLCLKFLISNWHSTPAVTLWAFNTNRNVIWWSFLVPHIIAWTIIYVGIICMDVNELLGLKQVYYYIKNLPDPLTFKSLELKRLYSHVRHPSFIGFLILLWVTPIMSLDRLLLATILSSYMYLAWNTNQIDYRYQETQYVTKFHELNRVK